MRNICLISFLLVLSTNLVAQFNCGPNTPLFTVDLSGDPNATWASPDTVRNDLCCGATAPDKCVGFEVTLHPQAEGIIFEICDGAMPPGAIYYQVDCGTPTPVGEALCLSGVGPHYITFCKPGNNINVYCITSIAEPSPGPNTVVNEGCTGYMYVDGYNPDSLVWTSVFPGNPGDYDGYLDCTSGCDSVNVLGQANAPDSVLYQVCGPLLGDCDTAHYCDTITAYFNSTLGSVISPEQPMVCFGSSGTWIYASGTGGSPPYNFTWSTGSTQDSIFVNVGTYILEVGDTSGCPPAYDTVVVGSFTATIEALAGNDTTYCTSLLPIQLNGSVVGASTGSWIGGDGTFAPDSLTLNATYQPGPQDSANGFIELYLITTGTGTCPPDTDSVIIDLHTFDTEVLFNVDDVSCFGGADGSIQVASINGISITQFEWDLAPPEFGDSIGGLSAGTYSVLITDSLGCDSVATITVVEPALLELAQVSLTDATCIGYADGSIEITSSGGTPTYSYSWSNGSTGALASNLAAGSYTVTVTDANGCTDIMSFVVSEPPGITISLSGVNVECNGDATGAATVNAAGPYAGYTYQWNSGSNAAIIFNIPAGMYTVTVTYGNGCLDSDSIAITEPDELTLTLDPEDISCYGFNDGSIISTASGGVTPYDYLWSNAATSTSLNGLSAGTYTLTLTDDNGCDITSSAVILEPDSLDITESLVHVSCYGFNDGSIMTQVSGGILPYTYSWNTGGNTNTINNMVAGTYTINVTDSNGCTASGSYVIMEPQPLTAILDASNITCNGGSDGWTFVSPSGGTFPYSYSWSAGSVQDSATNLMAGTYTVTITDNNGCVLVRDTVITQPTPIQIQTSNNTTICLFTSAVVYVAASGSNGGYSYSWSHGLGNNDSHVVSPGETTTYVVSVTDTFNCPPAVDSITINVKPVYFDEITVTSTPPEICLGKEATIIGSYTGNLQGYTVQWSPAIGTTVGSYNVSPEETTSYIMTVIDDCGFSESDTVTVVVNPFPFLEFPELIADGCAPLNVTFNSGISGMNISTYKWKFGNGQQSSEATPTVTYFNPGTFDVTFSAVTDKGCESEGDGTGQVIVYPRPEADFDITPDKLDTDHPDMHTVDKSVDAVIYEWNVSDGAMYNVPEITHSFADWGDYLVTLMVENIYGCRDTLEKPVYVDPVLVLDFPTAFTPNPNYSSDGMYDPAAMDNDIFYLITRYVSEFHLVIYNRWGETVFETFDPKQGWNGYYKGQLAPMAMYVWRVDIKFVNDKELTETGHVTLLR